MEARPPRPRVMLARAAVVLIGCLLAVGLGARPTLALGAPSANTARAASVLPYQAYTDWTWAARGYASTIETLTVNQVDPGSHYFWAYDFAVGGSGVGYLGLQAGSYPSGGRMALFSIWGADAATGPSCGSFEGEGVGWTCRLDPFAWAIGRSYALRIAVVKGAGTGTWYEAHVRDVATGAVHVIGRIHHPSTGGKVIGRGSWTEWFGGTSATCETLKRSKVTWGLPTSNDTIRTVSHRNHTAPKDGSTSCPGSTSVVDRNGSVLQAVGPK